MTKKIYVKYQDSTWIASEGGFEDEAGLHIWLEEEEEPETSERERADVLADMQIMEARGK